MTRMLQEFGVREAGRRQSFYPVVRFNREGFRCHAWKSRAEYGERLRLMELCRQMPRDISHRRGGSSFPSTLPPTTSMPLRGIVATPLTIVA